MRRLVRQEEDFGCGIACIAYICEIDYNEAQQSMLHPDKAQTVGYRCKALCDALNRICEEKKVEKIWRTKYVGRTRNPNIPDDSIVYINKNNKYKYGHYMVKTKYGYMNPFANLDKVNGDSRFATAKYESELYGIISLIITNKDIKYEKDL